MARKKKESKAEMLPDTTNSIPEAIKEHAPISFKVSVRSLVAFSIPEDTTWSFTSYKSMQEGTQAHVEIQNRHRVEGFYQSEVYLSRSIQSTDCTVEMNGRADGIWTGPDQTIIHEIKTTATPLGEIGEDFSEGHWAQGKCYAYLYAMEKDIPIIHVRLTYYNRAQNEEKSFQREYTIEKLQKFIKTLIHPFASWALAQAKWRQIRNLSIRGLEFPFKAYRNGQKLLAYNTYKCIQDGRRIFAQAPTGTGKTMGVLYPAIKSLGEGTIDRIFYLTAKTTTRAIAENAYHFLCTQGIRLKTLTLTAKEKLCLNSVKNCTPDKCLYIQSYPSRSRKAVKELIKKEDFLNKDNITQAGIKHGLCPFELSLDLALQCDLIICDYNYVFDPRIYLKRFFQQKGREEYLILVDEAHNLFTRAREMYSSTLEKQTILKMSKEVKDELPLVYKSLREISKALGTLEKVIQDDLQEAGGTSFYTSEKPPEALFASISNFVMEAEHWMLTRDNEEKTYTEDLISLFFDLLHYKNIFELFSSQYRTLITGSKSFLKVTLLCLDPSKMLHNSMTMAKSTVLFSATLSPLSYFKKILGGQAQDATLRLPSPFPRENLLIINEDRVETRFKYRERYMEQVALSIHAFVKNHTGNYLVFFPSYKYMTDVLTLFDTLDGDFEILCQQRDMDEASRDAFLAEFDTFGDMTRIGFCVMGGIFGEGIDLTGDRLTGVAIVGVGLPQVSPELEVMRSYYQDETGSGFAFAYTYPGLNRVLQAAGRLIRTETDRGALLLIDSRFASYEYQTLYPDEWEPIPRTSSGFDIAKQVKLFWERA